MYQTSQYQDRYYLLAVEGDDFTVIERVKTLDKAKKVAEGYARTMGIKITVVREIGNHYP